MRKILCLLPLLLLYACGSDKEKQSQSKPSIIQAMTTPIYASQGKSSFLVSDYLVQTDALDSITYGKGIKASGLENGNTDAKSFELAEDAPYISYLTLWTDGIRNDIPVYKPTGKQIRIVYPGTASDVEIKGEFTNWVNQPLLEENGELVFETSIPEGSFQYLFLENGQEENLSGTEPHTVSNGMGGFNRVVENKAKGIPARLNHGKITESGFSFTTTGPLEQVVVLYENQLLETVRNGNTYNVQIPKIPMDDRLNKTQLIRVYASDQSGRTNDLLIPVQDGQVVTDPDQLARTDFHTQVLYFMMVDRFLDADPANTKPVDDADILPKANYMGGDLAGVLQKIKDGYFEDLGVNSLWLSPIVQNPKGAYGLWPEPKTKFSGYHGYWPISSTRIDDRLGDQELLEELINEAHNRDMNVILDYVANHVHEEHPVYKNHPEWATDLYLEDGSLNTERWDDQRLTTWFDTFMPTLDFSQPEVVEKMTDSAMYWMKEYKIDGFRHDATKHVPEVYWRTLTQKIRQQTKRSIYQIGETYGSYDLIRSYVNTGMLDAQFDFNHYDAAVSAFAKADLNYGNLVETLQKGLSYYGHHHLMGNISGNQDRARFISYASGDVRFDEDAKAAGWTRDIQMSDPSAYNRLGMLQAYNMSIPGVPVIYYGDEYGAIGANDPDNRRMMRFEGLSEQEKELKSLIQSLVKLRRDSMSLLYGTTEVIAEGNGILSIKRRYFNEETIVYFNENRLIMNVLDKNERFKQAEVNLINALENDTHVQVRAGNFAIIQMTTKTAESK
ncbi:alpha-amylase family glycosyl hydrolase [Nonlabens xiamenensis]|uniref:alpha-amylase family glycosyl hydrolase n=1 Tax=Nonlabens xiamenensis TaxID=2341043 RepID=UPI000F60BF83|nr:alpha-amylase family glycosyl hydrolase [Nonlabens xiamenensis]